MQNRYDEFKSTKLIYTTEFVTKIFMQFYLVGMIEFIVKSLKCKKYTLNIYLVLMFSNCCQNFNSLNIILVY